jgi:hypothetical protein
VDDQIYVGRANDWTLMDEPELRLTLTEGFEEGERSGTPKGKVALGNSGEFGLRVAIKPPIRGGLYTDPPADVEFLILIAYFAGRTFFPICKWPLNVRVSVPLVNQPETRDRFQKDELYMIAFGMLLPNTSGQLMS